MIKINDKNNYLEIINEFDIHNIQSAFYSKKDTTFDVFYLDQPTPIERESGEPMEGEPGETIDVAVPQPIRIGNIQIKRFGRSIVIDSHSFENELVYINGRLTDFENCLDFLTLNTAV